MATHQHTPTTTGYDATDRCRECGEHIADPHAPECPQGQFEQDLADHASAVLAGEFTEGDLQ